MASAPIISNILRQMANYTVAVKKFKGIAAKNAFVETVFMM